MSYETGTVCWLFQPWLQLSRPAFLRWREGLCWGNINFFLQHCGLASSCTYAHSEFSLSALPCLRTAYLSIRCIVKNGITAHGKSSLLSLLENVMYFWHGWYFSYSIILWVTVWFAQVIADKGYMSGEQVIEIFFPLKCSRLYYLSKPDWADHILEIISQVPMELLLLEHLSPRC